MIISRRVMVVGILLVLLSSCLQFISADNITNQVDTKYGEDQLNHFLDDCPQLQSIVKRGNPIWLWLRDKFGFQSDGIKIVWQNGPTSNLNPFGGECRYSDEVPEVYIRIDRTYKSGQFAGITIPAEEVLLAIVFELNNVKNRTHAIQLAHLVNINKINKHDYALATARDEYFTSLETNKFYKDIWIPFVHMNSIDYVPDLWKFTEEKSFESWLASFEVKSGYPFLSYGKEYDEIRASIKNDIPIVLDKFTEYKFKECGFSIESPINLIGQKSYKSDDLVAHKFIGLIPGKIDFEVLYSKIPDEAKNAAEEKELLDSMRDGLIGSDFTLKSENMLTIDKGKARDLFYSFPSADGSNVEGHSRIILSGKTVYIISVNVFDRKYSSNNFQRCFDSFKIIN